MLIRLELDIFLCLIFDAFHKPCWRPLCYNRKVPCCKRYIMPSFWTGVKFAYFVSLTKKYIMNPFVQYLINHALWMAHDINIPNITRKIINFVFEVRLRVGNHMVWITFRFSIVISYAYIRPILCCVNDVKRRISIVFVKNFSLIPASYGDWNLNL